MRSIQWVSDNGHYILFCDKPPYILNTALRSDVGAVAQIFKAPFQDGATTYNASLEQRTITFPFTLIAKGNTGLKAKTVLDEHCNILNTAFTPKTIGWLIYTNNSRQQVIRARAVATPTVKDQGMNHINFDLELLTDMAVWQSEKLNSTTIGELSKSWMFPFTFPVIFGNYTQFSTVNNPSTENIYPTFKVTSQLSTLKITNVTTSEYLEVTHTIAENQYMVIDTFEKTVSLYENGVYLDDVSNWMDGDFIKLASGGNVLKVENNIPNDIPAVVMYWRDIVMGV